MATKKIERVDRSATEGAEEVFLTGPQLKLRYGGVSETTLVRWLQHKELGFPKPYRIGERRLWKLSELMEYEKRCAAKASAPSRGNARALQDAAEA